MAEVRRLFGTEESEDPDDDSFEGSSADRFDDIFKRYERLTRSRRIGNLMCCSGEWFRLRDEIRLARDEVLGFFLGAAAAKRAPELAGTKCAEEVLQGIFRLHNPALRESLQRQIAEAGAEAVLARFPSMEDLLREE